MTNRSGESCAKSQGLHEPYFPGRILCQKAGGILLELIHLSEPVPRPIRKDFRYGDIGVAKITVAVSDVREVYEELKDKANFCSLPKVAAIPGWTDYPFVYCRDPEGNLVELVSASARTEGIFGGACSIGISVTDLERSVSFYRNLLGFHVAIIDIHEGFSGLVDEVSAGAHSRVRSCLLSANGKRDAMIELFEVLKPRGRSIPFSAIWATSVISRLRSTATTYAQWFTTWRGQAWISFAVPR